MRRSKRVMSIGPLQEHESTYIVQDRQNRDEIVRLELQDKMITSGMGGVLAELENPPHLRRVLDVGCGTGGWLIETARTYASIEKLIGADISCKIVAYAQQKATAEGLDGRVQFRTMDALRRLDFPAASFDLVNQRFGISWLRTWEWKKVLLEYQRVTRPGGVIRLVEGGFHVESTSLALTKLCDILLEATYRSGRLFTNSSEGVKGKLVPLLTEHGLQDVGSYVHTLVYRAGAESGQYLYDDIRYLFRVAVPFFQKWMNIPEDYTEIYQQALCDIRQPDFVAKGTFLTVWGTRPEGPVPLMRGLN